jgi:hypothetical protein
LIGLLKSCRQGIGDEPAARSRTPLAEVESKPMQLLHRITALKVAIVRREAA